MTSWVPVPPPEGIAEAFAAYHAAVVKNPDGFPAYHNVMLYLRRALPSKQMGEAREALREVMKRDWAEYQRWQAALETQAEHPPAAEEAPASPEPAIAASDGGEAAVDAPPDDEDGL